MARFHRLRQPFSDAQRVAEGQSRRGPGAPEQTLGKLKLTADEEETPNCKLPQGEFKAAAGSSNGRRGRTNHRSTSSRPTGTCRTTPAMMTDIAAVLVGSEAA
jgi:hypothetical protein